MSSQTREALWEQGRKIMLTPALSSPNERGKPWLLTKTQQILADNAVILATPRSEHDSSCYWGTGLETGTTLYLRLAGDPEPKALCFPPTTIAACGAGLYVSQQQATAFIRRTLKKMGSLPVEHTREVSPWPRVRIPATR